MKQLKLTNEQKQKAQQIKDEVVEDWIDDFGMITSLDRATSSRSEPLRGFYDNEAQCLSTGVFHLFCHLFDCYTEDEVNEASCLINALQTINEEEAPIYGLFNRHPRQFQTIRNDKKISYEELTGIAGIAYLASFENVVRAINSYGQITNYLFDNWNPFKGNYREPINKDVAFYKILNGQFPGISSITVLCTYRAKEVDWFRLQFLSSISLLYSTSLKLFNKTNYLSHIFDETYNNEEHPFHRFAKLYDEVLHG